MPVALIVDRDEECLLKLSESCRRLGFQTEIAQDRDRARDLLRRAIPDVTLIDEGIDDPASLSLLDKGTLQHAAEMLVMTANRSLEGAERAMRAGASDYLTKPIDDETLKASLDRLLRNNGAESGSRPKNSAGAQIIGRSPQMQRVYRLIRKVSPSPASVFVTGESGVGKELVARAIHEASNRSGQALVTVNCSAIPSELVESELFGHKRGSFTGAARDHSGFFQQAHRGTLFLDEISEMDVSLQAKLLRSLESQRIRPVGAEQSIEVDCRVIAASNQDPARAVSDGRLREDLVYRLAQFPIRVPPLRERGDDVLLLAEHFLAEQNISNGIEKTFADDTIEAMMLHDWPGNVRELRNAIVHAYLLANERIKVTDLPAGIPSDLSGCGQRSTADDVGLTLAEVGRRHILATLEHCGGNKKRTAECLGVALKTLYNHLHRYGEI